MWIGIRNSDKRRHGRKGPFARSDVVCWRRTVAKLVGVGGDGEVVHLIIHDDATFGNHDARAKVEVDGRREGDCKTGGIGGRDLRCAMAIVMISNRGPSRLWRVSTHS